MSAANPREIPRNRRDHWYLTGAVRVPIQTFIHTEGIHAFIVIAAAAAPLGWVSYPFPGFEKSVDDRTVPDS